ncbi:hypothetical protein ACWKWP_11595 [Agromyces soli]
MTNRTLSMDVPAAPVAASASPALVEEHCPRCDSHEVRAIVYGPLDLEIEAAADAAAGLDPFADDTPIFDCRDCGFEWGFAVRELLG